MGVKFCVLYTDDPVNRLFYLTIIFFATEARKEIKMFSSVAIFLTAQVQKFQGKSHYERLGRIKAGLGESDVVRKGYVSDSDANSRRIAAFF